MWLASICQQLTLELNQGRTPLLTKLLDSTLRIKQTVCKTRSFLFPLSSAGFEVRPLWNVRASTTYRGSVNRNFPIRSHADSDDSLGTQNDVFEDEAKQNLTEWMAPLFRSLAKKGDIDSDDAADGTSHRSRDRNGSRRRSSLLSRYFAKKAPEQAWASAILNTVSSLIIVPHSPSDSVICDSPDMPHNLLILCARPRERPDFPLHASSLSHPCFPFLHSCTASQCSKILHLQSCVDFSTMKFKKASTFNCKFKRAKSQLCGSTIALSQPRWSTREFHSFRARITNTAQTTVSHIQWSWREGHCNNDLSRQQTFWVQFLWTQRMIVMIYLARWKFMRRDRKLLHQCSFLMLSKESLLYLSFEKYVINTVIKYYEK